MQPLTEDEISVCAPSPRAHIDGTGQVELRQKACVLLTRGVRQCSLGYQGSWKSSWEILKAAITERVTLKCESKILGYKQNKNSIDSRANQLLES